MKYKITFSADFPSGEDIFVEDFVEVLEAEGKKT